MLAIGESLKQFWLRYEIKLQRGASQIELCAFENKYSVCLPNDLKDYLTTVNGFDGSTNWMTDENLITFLPLEEVVPLSQNLSREPEANSYFIFADFCISAHVYSIQLTNDAKLNNPVFIACDDNPIQVANTFSKFVRGYLEDDQSVLFPE
jgi:cell wall assembly regulator SMI1